MQMRKCYWPHTWMADEYCLFRLQTSEQYMQFSKKPIMSNFGDLPRGEIPEPLKFNRPFRMFLCLFSLAVCLLFYYNFRIHYPV